MREREGPGHGVILGGDGEFHACVPAYEGINRCLVVDLMGSYVQGASEQYMWRATSSLKAKGWKWESVISDWVLRRM